ncbi:helix-turn-helix domain-containing protein [Variovorax sp. OAS795]|uniref:MarR family transcriptional regulator n=1 Tax=Variovorax sp. OAS795 TaxID=3034231 RepID=UPI003399FF7B
MTMVFDRYPEGGSEMLLALALADHAHDDGTRIWPSVGELARKTRQSTRTVQRQLQKMVASGWLEMVSTATGRRGSTNEYRVTAAWVAGAHLAPRGDKVTPHEAGEVMHAGEGVIHTGDRLTPLDEAGRGDTGDARGDTAMSRGGDTAMSSESSGTVRNRNTPLPPGGGATGFDELWAIYPNHDNRLKAERRYRRMAPNAALQQTMRSAIEAQRLSKRWTKDGGEFVLEFATWLRNERWRDVPRAHGAPSVVAGAWHETRSGIDAKARALGLAPWDEAAFSVGRGENYPTFTARVMRAAERAGEAVCA